jgi:hypothetical protein
MPYLFGGDVLSSSDTLLEANVVEAGDPRELIIAEAIKALVDDETPISTQLRGLGIRWVVLQTTSELAERYAALGSDPGLTVVLDSPEITLFAVVDWLGLVRTADGRPVPADQLGSIAYRLQGDFSGGAILSRAGSRGWLQGWSRTFVTQEGQLAVPRVRGTVWHPGTALALLGYVIFTVVSVCCFRQRKDSA